MKKDKLKTLVKSARKTAKEVLRSSIALQLKDATSKLGLTSKKVNKAIEKTAKQLAKKLSSEVTIDKDALAITVPEPVEVKTAEPQKIAKTPSKKASAKPKAAETVA